MPNKQNKQNRQNKKIRVMAVLNVTPDSFFDGGKYRQIDSAVNQALSMQEAGADIIDIGGESTRPGAAKVSIDEELQRVIPVIEAIRSRSDIAISVDTSKPEVMRAAINAGGSIINDVRALDLPHAMETAVALDVPVCLMHMQGEPDVMQNKPDYFSVVDEILGYLVIKANECIDAGIKKHNIWIDPGFGFGKTLQHNLVLLKQLPKFVDTGYPVLVGMSRKSMLGELLGRKVEDRLAGSLALASIAVMKGASVIRVHDVKETVDVVKVFEAVVESE